MSDSRGPDRHPETSDLESGRRRFERFLKWLDRDRDSAGIQYEKVRRRLVSLLSRKGAATPEALADTVLERVVAKVDEIAPNYEGDPYFYVVGVARLVFLESIKKRPVTILPPVSSRRGQEREHACLDRCLVRLPSADRERLLSYYRHDKRRKIRHRQEMAADLDVDMNTLRLRIFRLRQKMRDCLTDCLEIQEQDVTFPGDDTLGL